MNTINFFEDSSDAPRSREDVRFKQFAVFVHQDGSRRIAVGFDITPFIERPSIEVVVVNERGERAGSLTVIENYETNFHLTLHLRDREPAAEYEARATLYYVTADNERMVVDSKTARFDATQPGSEVIV